MDQPSEQQLAANRANAQLSTGPITDQGKRRSSLNALRHGLTGRVVVLPSEDLAKYQAFSADYVASLQPQGPVEAGLAQTAADQQWRLQRIQSIEEGMFACAHFDQPGNIHTDHPAIHSTVTDARAFTAQSQAFVNLSIYQARVYRLLEKSLRQLHELQTERTSRLEAEAQKAQAQMEEAVKLHNLHKAEQKPFHPQELGFVYSAEAIERAAALRDLRNRANSSELAATRAAKAAAAHSRDQKATQNMTL